MKELSIEEKVKAYDELLIKAKQIHNKENDVLILHTIEDLFPELKESEDERIRKRIIALVNAHGQGMYKDEVLAWLEKQGEQKPTIEMKSAEESLGIDSETYNKIVDECIYSEQKLAELPKVKSVPMSFMEKLGIFMQYTSVDLEKEENKQLLNEAAKELLQLAYSDKANEIALASAKTWEESMAILIAANNAYRRGQKEYKPTEWTADDEEELKIALNTLEKAGQYSSAKWLKNVCLVPQIIQKPAWSEEDENMIEAIEALCDDKIRFTEFKDIEEYAYKIKNWLKSLKDRVQPKQEWSEEDEELYDEIRDAIYYSDCVETAKDIENMKETLFKAANWMEERAKYLKPQPKQEWNDEDESNISELCSFITESYSKEDASKLRQWLKSIRPQTTWKPSDEQMNNK